MKILEKIPNIYADKYYNSIDDAIRLCLTDINKIAEDLIGKQRVFHYTQSFSEYFEVKCKVSKIWIYPDKSLIVEILTDKDIPLRFVPFSQDLIEAYTPVRCLRGKEIIPSEDYLRYLEATR